MTKASLRRQQLREEQAAVELEAQSQQTHLQETDPAIQQQQQSTPRMEPPPPYDAPYLPAHNTSDRGSAHSKEKDSGCMNVGPGKTEGCLVLNTGSRGLDFVVKGCLNIDSDDGCLNYESQDGCMNYRSHDGCLNYEVSAGGGCLNYRTTGGGCLNFRSSRGGCLQFGTR